jgi:hypothetical protein
LTALEMVPVRPFPEESSILVDPAGSFIFHEAIVAAAAFAGRVEPPKITSAPQRIDRILSDQPAHPSRRGEGALGAESSALAADRQGPLRC